MSLYMRAIHYKHFQDAISISATREYVYGFETSTMFTHDQKTIIVDNRVVGSAQWNKI